MVLVWVAKFGNGWFSHSAQGSLQYSYQLEFFLPAEFAGKYNSTLLRVHT